MESVQSFHTAIVDSGSCDYVSVASVTSISRQPPTPGRRDSRSGHSIVSDGPVCRICQDSSSKEKLVSACKCRGTMGNVHVSCLERWLAESNSNTCEVCGHVFKTVRVPRYSALAAMAMWATRPSIQVSEGARVFRSDCISCCVLTPVIFVGIYFSIQTADYYYREDSSSWPPAKWTTAGLFSLVALVVIFYYLWVYVVFRYHSRLWYNWWQKNYIVQIVSTSLNSELKPIKEADGESPPV